MITTTDAPTWLRRSDQAVTWARTMLQPHRAVVIDCETTDLPGAICEVAVVDTEGRISVEHAWSIRAGRSLRMPPGYTTSPTRWLPAHPDFPTCSVRFFGSRRVGGCWPTTPRSTTSASDPTLSGTTSNSEHLDDPDTWGCIMRARSAWVGSPDHFYPLGAAHRAVGDAVAALAVLQAIAEDSGLHR